MTVNFTDNFTISDHDWSVRRFNLSNIVWPVLSSIRTGMYDDGKCCLVRWAKYLYDQRHSFQSKLTDFVGQNYDILLTIAFLINVLLVFVVAYQTIGTNVIVKRVRRVNRVVRKPTVVTLGKVQQMLRNELARINPSQSNSELPDLSALYTNGCDFDFDELVRIGDEIDDKFSVLFDSSQEKVWLKFTLDDYLVDSNFFEIIDNGLDRTNPPASQLFFYWGLLGLWISLSKDDRTYISKEHQLELSEKEKEKKNDPDYSDSDYDPDYSDSD